MAESLEKVFEVANRILNVYHEVYRKVDLDIDAVPNLDHELAMRRLAVKCKRVSDAQLNYKNLKQPFVIDAFDLTDIAALAMRAAMCAVTTLEHPKAQTVSKAA